MTHPGRAKLSSSARAKKPLIIAGVGCGLTARGASEGGADLLAVYNTAIYRIRNLPSILAFLPGDDPNALTRAAAAEVVANAGDRPVLLGFAAHNPQLSFDRLLDQTVVLGGAGITNEPFVGLYGSAFGRELERAGCGFSREVAFIEAAARRGMMTLGWACDPEEARRMSGAGADLIGLMLGITSADNDADLHDAIERTHAMARAALSQRPDALLLVHGGPLDSPERIAVVLSQCPVHGYVTGSSAERNPVLSRVFETVMSFKNLKLLADLD